MEVEFKFTIPTRRLAAVKAAARRGTSSAIRLEARYFDTADKALSSRGWWWKAPASKHRNFR